MTHGTGYRRQKEEKLLSCWDYWLRQVDGGWISSAHGRCMGLEWKTLSSSFGHADGSELSKESCLRDTWTGTQGKLLQRQWDTSVRSSAGSNSSCARAGDSPSSWPTLDHWTKGAPPRGSPLQWTCSPKAQGSTKKLLLDAWKTAPCSPVLQSLSRATSGSLWQSRLDPGRTDAAYALLSQVHGSTSLPDCAAKN